MLIQSIICIITIIVQIWFSRPLSYCITDIILSLTLFLIPFPIISSIIFIFFEGIQIINLGSYALTDHGFDTQIFLSITPDAFRVVEKTDLWYVLVSIHVFFGLFLVRFQNKIVFTFKMNEIIISIFYVSSVFIAISFNNHHQVFDPFINAIPTGRPQKIKYKSIPIDPKTNYSPSYFMDNYSYYDKDGYLLPTEKRLELLFVTKPKATPTKPLKNLLMILFESLEEYSLGRFNRHCPKITPFLNKFSAQGLYASNAQMQPYTHYTIAAGFAAECGLPLLTTTTNIYGRGEAIHLREYDFCLGNHLKSLGYHLESHEGCDKFGGNINTFYMNRGYKVYDKDLHNKDGDTFKYVKDFVFPKMVNNSQPWAIRISTINTHLFDNLYQPDFCKLRNGTNGKCSKYIGFDCDDQILESFFSAFEQYGLHNNTEVIIFGDHQNMFDNGKYFQGKRSLPIFMPYREKKIVTRLSSVYDIAPTVLDALGIDYQPKYPFGMSLLGPNNISSYYPNQYEFFSVYHALKKYRGIRFGSVNCIDHFGFCTGNENLRRQRDNLTLKGSHEFENPNDVIVRRIEGKKYVPK